MTTLTGQWHRRQFLASLTALGAASFRVQAGCDMTALRTRAGSADAVGLKSCSDKEDTLICSGAGAHMRPVLLFRMARTICAYQRSSSLTNTVR